MSPDSLNSNQQLVPKIVRWVIALAALLLIGLLVIHFVMTGTLTVNTNGSTDSITVSSAPVQKGANIGKVAFTYNGTGSLTVRVPSGAYIVSVQNGAARTNEAVNVGLLAHKTVNLTPSGAATVEPVVYDNVANVAVDSTRMIYLTDDESSIAFLNTQNQEQTITSDGQQFIGVKWASAQYGVAQDSLGQLYIIDGTTVRPLQSPARQAGKSATAYAIAPDKTIYIGFGGKVFRGTEGAGFTQISTGLLDSGSLVAANGRVLLVNPGSPDDENAVITAIDTSGKTTTKTLDYAISGWTSWSPGGDYIIISVGTTPELFDSSLTQMNAIPQGTYVTGGTWRDNNTAYYYSAGQLWSYSVSQNQSELVATMPDGMLIQSLSLSADGSDIYMTVSNKGETYPRAVFRVGLTGQTVSADIAALPDVLPISGSTFSIGLRNFSGVPVIDVTTEPGTDTTVALQQAQQDMQGLINLSDVTFQVAPGD